MPFRRRDAIATFQRLADVTFNGESLAISYLRLNLLLSFRTINLENNRSKRNQKRFGVGNRYRYIHIVNKRVSITRERRVIRVTGIANMRKNVSISDHLQWQKLPTLFNFYALRMYQRILQDMFH